MSGKGKEQREQEQALLDYNAEQKLVKGGREKMRSVRKCIR